MDGTQSARRPIPDSSMLVCMVTGEKISDCCDCSYHVSFSSCSGPFIELRHLCAISSVAARWKTFEAFTCPEASTLLAATYWLLVPSVSILAALFTIRRKSSESRRLGHQPKR